MNGSQAAWCFALFALPVFAAVPPARHVNGHVLESRESPRAKILIDPSLLYGGSVSFIIKEMAEAELHVFVDADAKKNIRRMLVIQFEGFVPGNHHAYDAPITQPQRVGRYDYDSTLWRYDEAQDAAESPNDEAAHTRHYLANKGYRVPARWLMARFARPVGSDLRHELLLFYCEAAAADALPGTERLTALALVERLSRVARESFQVTDEE